MQRPLAHPEPAACSFHYPVCVHRGRGVSGAAALAALSSLERSFERLVLALGLPPPVPDQGAGASDAFDLYLVTDAPQSVATGFEWILAPFDQASSFCVARPERGITLDRTTSICLGEAISAALDAALAPHVRRAYAIALWWMIGEPTARDVLAVSEVAAHPERSIGARELDSHSEGAAILFEYLERQRGRGQLAQLSTSLLAAAANVTRPKSFRYDNEPDIFDVLRKHESPVEHATFWGNFAAARAFIGNRDDGQHLPALLWAGGFGETRFDWVIPASSLPRRVLSTRPIDPLGTLYLWFSLDQWQADDVLAFRASWERPVSFKWQFVQLDALGREIHRFHVPFGEQSSAAEQRLVVHGDARHIVISGINMGGTGAFSPFDPDRAPYEPHAATVYLARLSEAQR